MKARFAILPALAALVACRAEAGRAQSVHGSITGRVLRQSGEPESGATVVASGTNLLGRRSALTDAAGFFHLLALPPGNYQMRVTAIGRRPALVDSIRVAIDRATFIQTTVLAELPVVLDTVFIEAPPVSLDPWHTDAGGIITVGDYATLPGERDYKTMITILPHVNRSYRGDAANAAGATGLENMYFIDGANATTTLRNETGITLPYNFIRAVEIKTGGYEAQHGGAVGALVNAVTYSGGNRFESSVFGFFTHDQFAASARAEPTLNEGGSWSYDVGARVGGPIRQDRLWYSAAWNPRVDHVERQVAGSGTFNDRTTAQVFAGKLSWRPSDRSTATLSIMGDPTVRHGVDVPLNADGLAPINPDPYLRRVETGGVAAALRGSVILGTGLLLEAAASWSRFRSNDVAGTARGSVEPLFRDEVEGQVSGGVGFLERLTMGRSRLVIRATGTAGQHNAVLGIEYEDASATGQVDQSGGFRVDRRADSVYVTVSERTAGTHHNRVPTLYLQDGWRLSDAFSVNLGLRWSRQHLTGASGSVVQVLGNEWQPRIGFVGRPDGSDRHRIFASYGRYYQAVPLNLSSTWYVDVTFAQAWFAVDPRLPGAMPYDSVSFVDPETGVPQRTPGARAEHHDEFTVGYETALGRSGRLTLRGLRRTLRSSFQWGFGPSGLVIGTPGRGDFDFLPNPVREYTALELSTEGSWRALSFRASYVLSRSWGNYTGYFGTDVGAANPGGNATFIAPHQARNSLGLLPNDRPHLIKLASAWHATRTFGIGAIVTAESGTPVNAFAPGPRGPLQRHFAARRGSAGRTPALWTLDLRFSYEPAAQSRVRYCVLLDVLNVGNPQETVQVDELRFRVNNGGTVSGDNPNYRTSLAYQRPMMARIGFEVAAGR